MTDATRAPAVAENAGPDLRLAFATSGGVRLHVRAPPGAVREDEAALPTFELGPISGARVALRAGWRGSFGLLRVACASAPAGGFAPGVEDLVFGRATQIARAVLPSVGRLDAAPAQATPTGFEQRFDGDAVLDASPSRVVGRHLLAFTEHGAGAVVCSIACVARDDGGCAASVDSASLEGELAPPPPPSLVVRALFASVEHPIASLAMIAALGVAIIAVLLARRPRSFHRLG